MPKLKYTNEVKRNDFTTVQEYNRWYYEQHRERLSEKRKRRWMTDKKYREKMKAERRRYYYTQTAHQPGERKRGKRTAPHTPRLAKIHGQYRFLFRLGALSRILQRHQLIILRWVDRGILPCCYDVRGTIWFTEEILQRAKEVMDELGGECFPNKRAETEVLKSLLQRRLQHLSLEVFNAGQETKGQPGQTS